MGSGSKNTAVEAEASCVLAQIDVNFSCQWEGSRNYEFLKDGLYVLRKRKIVWLTVTRKIS